MIKDTSKNGKSKHSKSTMFSKAKFTKDDTIRYFMLGYCYTKFWLGEEECKAYSKKDCRENFTDECRQIALRKFKQTFDGRVCIKNFFSQMTIANRANLVDTQEDPKYVILRPLLKYITFFVILVMLVWKSYHNELLNLNWDKNFATVTDYSVLIKGLPKAEKIDKFDGVNVKKILSEELKRQGYNITQMNFVFDTEEFLALKKKYTEERTKIAKEEYKDVVIDLNSDNEVKRLTSSSNLNKIKSEIIDQQKKFNQEQPKGMVGAVIVSFLTAGEAYNFLESHQLRRRYYEIFGCIGKQSKPLEVRFPRRRSIDRLRMARRALKHLSLRFIVFMSRSLLSQAM